MEDSANHDKDTQLRYLNKALLMFRIMFALERKGGVTG